jgi:leader peptidase (prepilin peptidase)/N-methyltransferase
MFVEIGMGALFAITAVRYGPTPGTALVAAFIALLLVISLIDWDRSLVLDKLTVPGTVFAVALAPIAPWAVEGVVEAWTRAGLGATVGFFAFFPISFLAPRWLGFGDVKLAGLIGAMVGFPLVGVALWSGVVLGGFVGGVVLASGVRKRGQHIPFAPYLAGGAAFSFLYGRPFLDWYLALLRIGF